MLIECTTQRHSSCLLKSTVFCNVPIKVTADSSLNSSKEVIGCRDLEDVIEEEICQNVSSQDATTVRQRKVRRNNELLPSNTVVLTCARCGQFDHDNNTCVNDVVCINCLGNQYAYSRVPTVETGKTGSTGTSTEQAEA